MAAFVVTASTTSISRCSRELIAERAGIEFRFEFFNLLNDTVRLEIPVLTVPRAKLGGSKSQPVLRNYTTDRRGTYLHEKFDYLGYTFRARRSKNRWGKYFVNFSPGVSNAATKEICDKIRCR